MVPQIKRAASERYLFYCNYNCSGTTYYLHTNCGYTHCYDVNSSDRGCVAPGAHFFCMLSQSTSPCEGMLAFKISPQHLGVLGINKVQSADIRTLSCHSEHTL